LINTEIFVVRDHGPPAEDAVSFHTTRWTIVMTTAQNLAPSGQSALAVRRIVARGGRQHRVGSGRNRRGNHALCEALIASEGPVGP
jgi:hypothetical protein